MSNEIDLVVGSEAFAQITELIKRLGDVDKKFMETATLFSNLGKGSSNPQNSAELDKIIAENTNLNKIIAQQSKEYNALNKSLNDNVKAISAKSKSDLEATLVAREKHKTAVLEIKSTEDATSAYVQAAGAYANLDAKYKASVKTTQDLAAANKQNTKDYKDSLKATTELSNQLKKIDSDVGKHTRNVGNYASSWNGLGNSINQLTREAPAFANSVSTGFMALSNNLPILGDEINQIIEKNKVLAKAGEKTSSVFSQVATAFFSWQTLISLGVTLLTVYGSKLIDMAMGLGDVKKQLEDLDRLQKKYNNNLDNTTKTILHQAQLAKDEVTRKRGTQAEKDAIDEDANRKILKNNEIYRDVTKKAMDDEAKRILAKKGLSKVEIDLSNVTSDALKALSKESNKAQDEYRKLDSASSNEFSKKEREQIIKNKYITANKEKAMQVLIDSEVFYAKKNAYTKYNGLAMKAGTDLSELTSAQSAKAAEATDKLANKPIKKEKKILDFDEVKSQHDLAEAKLNTLKIEEASVDISNWTTAQKVENLEKLSLLETEKIAEIANKEIALSKEKADTDFTANSLALKNKTISLEKYSSNKTSIEDRTANEIKTIQVKLSGKITELAFKNDKIISDLDDKDLKSTRELAIAKVDAVMNADKKIADNADSRVKYSMEEREKAFKAYIIEAKKKMELEKEMQLTAEKDPLKKAIIIESFKKVEKSLDDLLSPTEAARKAMMELFKSGNDKTLESTLDRLGASSLKTFLSIDDNGKSAFQNMWKNAEGAKEKTAVAVQAISAITQNAFSLMQASSDNYYKGEFARLEAQKNASLEFAGTSAVAKAKIEEDYDKKKKELEIKQFKEKQKMSVANIVISTAEAVMMAWATMPPPAAAIAMPIIAGLSLVEIGMVLAQKPPAYAEGTDNHSGGLMLVNDGNGSNFEEKVILPSGKVIRPQGRNVLMDAPKGTKVLNHEQQLFEMLQKNNISMSEPKYQGMTSEEMDMILEKHFSNIKTQNTIFDKNGFQSYVKNGNSITRSNSNRSQAIGISV